MRFWTVHRRERGLLDEPDLVLVRDGFSWWAAIFGGFWAFRHRLWAIGVVLLALDVLMGVGLDALGADDVLQVLAGLAFAAIVGFLADELRRGGLARRGYSFEAIVCARDEDAATQRYLEAMEHRR